MYELILTDLSRKQESEYTCTVYIPLTNEFHLQNGWKGCTELNTGLAWPMYGVCIQCLLFKLMFS